jgi:hypothetical protein
MKYFEVKLFLKLFGNEEELLELTPFLGVLQRILRIHENIEKN